MANTLVTCTDTVTFHGASLLVLKIFGVPHVALKAIVQALGLQWEAQYKRLKRHPVLSTCMSITDMQLPGDTQTREVVCLPLDKLNGWLFGVTVSRTRPEIRERLIAYQRECFDVLAGHFMPQTKEPPIPQIEEAMQPWLNVSVNWDYIIGLIQHRKVPREALLAIAQEATQALYVQVCNDGEKGVGAKITAQLKDMAQTDLKEVANHACMELWMRAGVSKQPKGASSDISKAGAV